MTTNVYNYVIENEEGWKLTIIESKSDRIKYSIHNDDDTKLAEGSGPLVSLIQVIVNFLTQNKDSKIKSYYKGNECDNGKIKKI